MCKQFVSVLLAFVLVVTLALPSSAKATEPDEMHPENELTRIESVEALEPGDEGNVKESPILEQDAEPDALILTGVSDGTIGGRVSGVLENKGDTKTYQITVDHSTCPEFAIYAYTSCGAPGYTNITIESENVRVGGLNIRASNPSTSQNLIKPRDYINISNTSGEVQIYTITAEAATDNAGYTISVGAKDDLTTHFGGPQNAISAGKILQMIDGMSQFFSDYTELLNGEGDWFRYTPESDNATYVGNYIFGEHQTAFKIYDAETLTPLFDSDVSKDKYLYVDEFTTRTILQNRFMLERGKEYLIRNYTPTGITPADNYVEYRTYIGLPSVNLQEYNYKSTKSYTVPANKKTTFYIDVAGQPDTYRCDSITEIRFCVSNFTQNASITSCKITAPNGKVFDTKYGRTQIGEHPDLVDFLNNNQNIPINGRWKIEILTSKTMSNMHFSMGYYVYRLNRTTPPQITS